MKKLGYFLITCIILSVFLTVGCADENGDNNAVEPTTNLKVNSCVGCHTNYEHLKAVYTPDPPAPPSHGCGGAPPHFEPYDRVYLSGSDFEEFKKSIHGQISCVTCHNGVDGTDNKEEAHSNNFLAKPSLSAKEKCGNCHPSIVNRTVNSIHEQGWGQKNMLVRRSGYGEVPTDFDKLPEEVQDGYNHNCKTCHGTCGDCHVVRPKVKGGGLAKSHAFTKTPDMRNVCTACHVSRGGHAYFGVAPGTQPDVHLTAAGYSCIDCHTQNEIHGDGNIYDIRYKMPLLPKCENCHAGIENANLYHTMHINTFNCQTCHSQDYNNCGSCHIGSEEGARVPAHLKFKIALNPIPDIKPYKLATVREALSAPDSWKDYGIQTLANFAVAPTYKYTTPHNILRWTQRTLVDTVYDSSQPECAQSCHIVKTAEGEYRNKEFFISFNRICSIGKLTPTEKLWLTENYRTVGT
ncbi:MAG: hypothetical protein GXO87_14620 [Chlorobi bacterium]|nr:hypothetical protein [Chlorobiota bacterium]